MFEDPRLRGDFTLDQEPEEEELVLEAEVCPAPGKVPRVLRYARDASRRSGYTE